MEDKTVVDHIQELVHEEQRLYAKSNLTDQEARHLQKMKVELDQCWDYLRQRQALRDAHRNPEAASIRPPSVVENYEQ